MLDAMEEFFPHSWFAGLAVCHEMMTSLGPLAALIEPNIQCAFRRLLRVAWIYHFFSKTHQMYDPDGVLPTMGAVSVEPKQVVQAAKALGEKEEDIKEPTPEEILWAVPELAETAFMWAIMGSATKGVVDHLKKGFKVKREKMQIFEVEANDDETGDGTKENAEQVSMVRRVLSIYSQERP